MNTKSAFVDLLQAVESFELQTLTAHAALSHGPQDCVLLHEIGRQMDDAREELLATVTGIRKRRVA